MTSKDALRAAVERHATTLVELSHQLHEHPETAFEERQACAWVSEPLEQAGFAIDRNIGTLETAFKATYGSGSLNIAICAEYDALPRLGHACGHNIIAAAAVGAALALATVAEELDLTVTVLGTPAEEGGGGKIPMLKAGAFDGVHAAMMVHPNATERDAMTTLAVSQLQIDYTGRPSHAAARPQHGVNALAALTLAQAGLAMLREHTSDSSRIHGIVTAGGDAPNIVPAHTRARWYVRARTTAELLEIERKVFDVFKGAALMTGCKVEITHEAPSYSELKTNDEMAALWRNNAAALGRTSTPASYDDPAASTDMGNVSYAVPSIHPMIAIDAGGAGIHEAGFAAAAVSKSGDQAIVDGAIGLAWTAFDIANDTALRDQLVQSPYAVNEVAADENAYLGYEYDVPVVYDPSA